MIEGYFSLPRRAGKKFYGRWVERNKEKQYTYKQNVLIAVKEEEHSSSLLDKTSSIEAALNDFRIH